MKLNTVMFDDDYTDYDNYTEYDDYTSNDEYVEEDVYIEDENSEYDDWEKYYNNEYIAEEEFYSEEDLRRKINQIVKDYHKYSEKNPIGNRYAKESDFYFYVKYKR